MIRYALSCAADHPFEGWFASSDDYDRQEAGGLLECPLCGSRTVRKQIMAPGVSGTRKDGGPDHEMMMQVMERVRAHVEDSFEDVGDAFASEARAIHEGKSEERGIYGQATGADVVDLVRDGVPIAPLPPKRRKKSDLN